MAKKLNEESFIISVEGEALSPISGAVAENIETLLEKPSKDTASLIYEVVKTQVELLCQKGDTDGAMEAIEKYIEQEFKYSAPLNIFKKDWQNGGAPFIGAHSFVGAFRDAARSLYPNCFYQKKGDKTPAKKLLRKQIEIIPVHIFFYRDGKKVMAPDDQEGQNPVPPEVKGFARYEVIYSPVTFSFKMHVYPKGPFLPILGDRDIVMECLLKSTLHGIGSRRSAGYGVWKINSTEITTI